LDNIFRGGWDCSAGAEVGKKLKVKMKVISFDEAYKIVMSHVSFKGTETVSFIESLGRILAEDISSDMEMPPFNKATVDGFACRKADLGNDLEILETIAAGMHPEKVISVNQSSRIMTGAAVPEGADTVFMVEDSEVLSTGKVKFTGSFTKENIAYRGEDIKTGDTVIERGKLIRPQEIAVMAAVGCTSVVVGKKPVVAVISSGDELVEPFTKPGKSQIRNSNAYQLLAQLLRAGALGKYYGIAQDDKEETYSLLKQAIAECDIVLITGGVSMGDFDFIPGVMESAGINILFSRINVQPGKPTTFGIHPESLVFGLPGNPVSSFTQFELLVKPLICKMMGYNLNPVSIQVQMEVSFSRRHAERQAFIPVMFTKGGMVSPVEYHGSAHISALSHADGIISLPAGKKSIEKGEVVSVRQV
jgi:molybdopterin molybdotransferase